MRKHYPFYILLLLAAAKADAQSFGELNINDVRARFYANGMISMDPTTNAPNFEVPNGSGTNALFSAGLWIGGLDAANQLKLAAVVYNANGQDWYSGPLTTDGSASIDAATVQEFDHVWQVNTADVMQHEAYCNCLATPGCDVAAEFPGYTMPAYFNDWPAIGDIGAGQDLYLAPFTDTDGDGNYDPSNCDLPCAPGDQSLYFIFNDKGDVHLESGGQPIGIEVQTRPFAYNGPTEALSNTVFVEYRIINRGTQTLHDTYLALFTDLDLGCSQDDHIGCDVGRSLWYGYNGDGNDEDCQGASGYGNAPPAFGVTILCGPFQDPDALDNPLVADYTVAVTNKGSMYPGWGSGYGDQVTDNERMGLSYFSYWGGSGTGTDPSTAGWFYNRMRGISDIGQPQSYGGNGYGGTLPARFAFPNDSDPLGQGTNGVPQSPWSEVSAGNVPADRRGLGSMGPFTLEPGAINRVVVAFVYARSNAGGAMNSVAELQARVDSIRSFTNANDFCGGPSEDIPCNGGFATSIPQIAVGANAVLVVMPSIATDAILIQLPMRMAGANITLFDALGQRVPAKATVRDATTPIDISGLASGSYFISAEHKGERRVGRFVKE